MQLNLLNFMLIFGCIGWLEVISEEPDERKEYFHVNNANKGNIKIKANKDLAEVTTKGDSVQVIVNAGMIKIPAVAKHHNDKGKGNEIKDVNRNTMHLAVAADIGGLKREHISSRKRGGNTLVNKKQQLAYSQGKRTFENSIMLENWKENNKHYISRNLKRAHKVQGRSTLAAVKVIKLRHGINIKSRRRMGIAARKSEVDREIRLLGQSGSLHVRTGKKETKLVSENGNLDIFMANPDKEDRKTKTNSNAGTRRHSVFKEEIHADADRHIHIINPIGIELKRSYEAVKGIKRSKSRKIVGACNVPPCSTR